MDKQILSNRPRLYDSRPFSERTMSVIKLNYKKLEDACRPLLVVTHGVSFDDVFADTIIRCVNDLKLAEAPEDAILTRFVYLFRTTNTCYCLTSHAHTVIDYDDNRLSEVDL